MYRYHLEVVMLLGFLVLLAVEGAVTRSVHLTLLVHVAVRGDFLFLYRSFME